MELRNPIFFFFFASVRSIFELTPQEQEAAAVCFGGGVHCFVPAAPELVFPGMSACRHDSWEPFTTWKGLPRGIPAPPGICKGNS